MDSYITDYRLQTTDYRIWSTGYTLQTKDNRLLTTDNELGCMDFELQTKEQGPHITKAGHKIVISLTVTINS